ncbi:MAG: hypothetical protein FJ098_14805, partial [Deltaproteobacteria bacterium]|nr:hypothetical protein [Deltaproteobacteria bacterium]
MRRTRCAIVLALALLAPACDGGASGGPPAGDGAGGGYDFSVIGRDTAGPADTGAGEFTGWTGPILCSEDLVRGPCEDAWCPAQAPCFGGAADAGCVP